MLPPQPGDVPRTCADVEKARGELGYNPQTSFEAGIGKVSPSIRPSVRPSARPSIRPCVRRKKKRD